MIVLTLRKIVNPVEVMECNQFAPCCETMAIQRLGHEPYRQGKSTIV